MRFVEWEVMAQEFVFIRPRYLINCGRGSLCQENHTDSAKPHIVVVFHSTVWSARYVSPESKPDWSSICGRIMI